MLSVVELDGAGDLEPWRSRWQELADAAIEPNPFYEPWMLLPAIEQFGGAAALRFAMVVSHVRGAPARLAGFFPLEVCASYRRLPLHARLWRHRHCFLGTPLVRREGAGQVLAAFLEWLAGARAGVMMEWAGVPSDGLFYAALRGALRDSARRSYLSLEFERPLLVRGAGAEAYLAAALSGKGRKEFRRLERRLAEHGTLQYAVLRAGEDPAPWLAEFMALEAGGWKGRRGTAFACSAAGSAYFTRIATEAARRGRLMMLALRLAGRAIAMKCNFTAHDGAFAFKIAYDERYARFSPGALLELENLREVHRGASPRWMDSCADPDSFMLSRFWLERRRIAKLLSSAGAVSGDLLLSSLPLLRRLHGGVPAAAMP